MSRTIALVFVTVSFLFVAGMASLGWAAEKPKPGAAQDVMKPGKPVLPFMCPQGWHKKPGTTDLACVPNKPAPIACPKDYVYYEALDCSAIEAKGLKAMVSGCVIGCRKIVVVR